MYLDVDAVTKIGGRTTKRILLTSPRQYGWITRLDQSSGLLCIFPNSTSHSAFNKAEGVQGCKILQNSTSYNSVFLRANFRKFDSVSDSSRIMYLRLVKDRRVT